MVTSAGKGGTHKDNIHFFVGEGDACFKSLNRTQSLIYTLGTCCHFIKVEAGVVGAGLQRLQQTRPDVFPARSAEFPARRRASSYVMASATPPPSPSSSAAQRESGGTGGHHPLCLEGGTSGRRDFRPLSDGRSISTSISIGGGC